MSQEHDDSVAELRDLPREVAPDAALEQRIIAELRARSLVRSPRPAWRVRPTGWLVAASIVAIAFVAGMAAGRRGSASARPEASFALMLYGEIGGDSATQMARAMEYGTWARAEHEFGRVIGGEALGEPAADVGNMDVTAAGQLVGFFLIQAPDPESAARLAASCPHVKYGGRVVVREIQPT